MTTTAHTPGPWKATEAGGLIGVFAWGVKVCQLGTFGGSDPSTVADARLIAAAPDMLEALRGTLEFVQDCNPQDPELGNGDEECPADHPNCCGACNARRVVRAVLAKAEGSTT